VIYLFDGAGNNFQNVGAVLHNDNTIRCRTPIHNNNNNKIDNHGLLGVTPASLVVCSSDCIGPSEHLAEIQKW